MTKEKLHLTWTVGYIPKINLWRHNYFKNIFLEISPPANFRDSKMSWPLGTPLFGDKKIFQKMEVKPLPYNLAKQWPPRENINSINKGVNKAKKKGWRKLS